MREREKKAESDRDVALSKNVRNERMERDADEEESDDVNERKTKTSKKNKANWIPTGARSS